MDKQEVLTILNSLDVQVSMGRIDQPTYEALKQKWMQQLAAAETGTALPATPQVALASRQEANQSSTPQAEVEILACPKCAAPAQIGDGTQDLSKPLRCPFCETVYTLRQGQDNAQQLKKELIAWFDRVVVGSGHASSFVDINARRYIFSDALYPLLKKEVDRRMEAFDTVLELPLVQLKETTQFREFRPGPRLVALAQGDNQWLKTLVSRVTAEQLQHFAVVPDDRHRLQQLQLRLQSLIYYANLSLQAVSSRMHSAVIKQNIIALQESYQASLQEQAALDNERYHAFIVAQYERAGGALLVLDAMDEAFDRLHSAVPERLVLQMTRALAQLEKAQKLADSCAYNPLQTVSLQHGIRKDITVARIFQATVTAYEVVTRTQICDFSPFYQRLLAYVQQLAPVQDAEHLLWLLTSMSRLLTARAGEAPLPVVKDWGWLEREVAQRRKTGALGLGGERHEVTARFFHPYWAAHLYYTAMDGGLVKKTSTREGLVLVDATSIRTPLVVTLLSHDPHLPIVDEGTRQFDLLEKSLVSLPALLTAAMAERIVKSYASQQHAELKVLSTRMIGVVYLPAALAQYATRQKQREQVVSLVHKVNQQISSCLLLTEEFLRLFGV